MNSQNFDVSLPYFTLKELTALFKFKNMRAARKDIALGVFPVPVYKLAHKYVADVEVVQSYFAKHRQEGIEQVSIQDSWDEG